MPSAGTFTYALDRTRVTLVGSSGTTNQIQVAMTFGAAISPPPPPTTTDVMLGDLPQGSYHVDVVVAGTQPAQSLGSVDFTVTAPTTDRIRTNLTDLWWNPNESGWGVNVIDHPSGKLFLTWFAYDSSSRPIWYVAPDVKCTGPVICVGDLYRTNGPVFGDTFDAASVQRTKVGSVSLQYTIGILLGSQPPEGFEAIFSFDANPGQFIREDVFRQPF